MFKLVFLPELQEATFGVGCSIIYNNAKKYEQDILLCYLRKHAATSRKNNIL